MKPKIVLVCISKNEDKYIDEWINYHLKLGFDEIFVFQNDWDYQISNPKVHCIKYDGINKQLYCYNDFIIKNHNKVKWAAFFDVDEFLVLKRHNNIHDFIKEFENFDAIAINWVLFGDNNLKNEPTKNFSVLNRFTKRQWGVNRHIKSIVKISEKTLFIDNPHCVEGIAWVDSNFKIGMGPFNDDGDDNVVQLNHYFCKTVKEFEKKIERRRADSYESIRTMEDFNNHNYNVVFDFSALLFSREKTLVEFVIPTFNRINKLGCLLYSLMSQSDDDWSAHVVIDNFDDQAIIDFINSFETNKIYYTFTGKNYNDFGHTPREIGKRLSIADYVIMTGDDNYYTPNLVEEVKKNSVDKPILIYWDMIHNHKHYQTKKDYVYWKTLLVNCGVDIGSFATRSDILINESLDVKEFQADGILLEKILFKYCSNYMDYMSIINEMVKDNDFLKDKIDLVNLNNVVRIEKVLYVHN